VFDKIKAKLAALREQLKGWKTIAINVLTGLPAALYGLYVEFASVDFTPVIPAKYAAAAVVGMSVVGVLLRIITTGPVGAKGDVAPKASDPAVKAGD
jgi:hypothetical protein